MSNDVHKSHNNRYLSAAHWFLGRITEIDCAIMYSDLRKHDCLQLPMVDTLELISGECDLQEIDVSDMPLVYKLLYFLELRDQLTIADVASSTTLDAVNAKIQKLRRWLMNHYPRNISGTENSSLDE